VSEVPDRFSKTGLPQKRMRIPQQDNGCDCGLFLLTFIERFVCGCRRRDGGGDGGGGGGGGSGGGDGGGGGGSGVIDGVMPALLTAEEITAADSGAVRPDGSKLPVGFLCKAWGLLRTTSRTTLNRR
jgi:hypothetical protein